MPKTKVVFATAALTLCALGCSGTPSTSDNDQLTKGGNAASAGSTNGGGASSGASSTSSGGASSTSSGGASSGGGNGSGGAALPWNTAWTECALAEECTVVPIRDCCGCNSTGVNRAFAAEAIASNAGFSAGKCPPLGCSSPGCAPDAAVACEAGQCVPKPGCSERAMETCEADGKCQKYQARPCTAAGQFTDLTCGKPKGACDDALTCRVSPTGVQVLFPDSCVPDGYTQACPSMCK